MEIDYFKESLLLHKRLKGKIMITPKIDVQTKDQLSLVYSPGVAEPCMEIHRNPESVWDYTIKNNTVAVVSDGSAVLGLGNIGAYAAIPVMEGKALLFKRFANIDAFPICIDTQDVDKIVETVRLIAPVFGGINLEDIAAPRSFEVEARLQNLGIPVFHDDQHGTAIVVLAALLNASKVIGKPLSDMKVVINGAGAAGIAIARLLQSIDYQGDDYKVHVNDIIICDTHGIIHQARTDLNMAKQAALHFTNRHNVQGTLQDALHESDVFIGVSVGDLLKTSDIQLMKKDSVIFALANPIPEIMPDEAYRGGAAIVGTGRSDLPNQVNNVLGFPGVFRGALDARAKRISPAMKMAAAFTIAECVPKPNRNLIIPPSLDEQVAWRVAAAVKAAALSEKG
ncbi:MAG TPA: NADP-dependent malic enzyme [Saprospiraceae bacterium]|nr:NADP-dependent malic enzyme [Saprospiraceae bacterium]HMP12937.1 NADP-dependent malic enzyme [Saprospiraceae bacterium]